ncbi:hypothetical protein [Embleya sp. NBC_00896]|uniref:hypothetical protein n=1 Tax=Embleya sp. NBC_00896 TaxID=2975961 RepID=UPI002F90F7B8|nr:hypothetical protein OG928_43535 [Embleya sp. NBC_00896]
MARGQSRPGRDDLYGPLNTPHNLLATYPPFTAMLFVPLAFVPLWLLLPIGVAVNA